MRTFDIDSFTQEPYRLAPILLIILGLFTISVCAKPDTATKPSPADIIHQAVAEGKIAYKLTEPNEIKAWLGEPQKEKEKDLGEIIAICMSYPDIEIGRAHV